MKMSSRYELKEPLGQGGMGVVYRAYDTVARRYVAIKTMRDIADPAAFELFEKEWSVLATLSHPNIVDILDTGHYEQDGRQIPYFVMPLLPGATLDKLIADSTGRLTVPRVIEMMCQTCRGLQAAHEHGLVHRDLKPSNLLVLEDDTVKIIDFGVVHLMDAKAGTGIKGTLQYMAPEQIEMNPPTSLSDIFSLGVVCYEALTGRKPFTRTTERETADAVRRHIPPPASDINPNVSEILGRVIHKAMAKQPWHRYSTAREFAETLQKASHKEPIERFDRSRIQPRIDRAVRAHSEGDLQFAAEILAEMEAEGHSDPIVTILRAQIEGAIRQKTIGELLDSARTRLEEREFSLALQKLQEILQSDPQNAEALAMVSVIEQHKNDGQIENWIALARQHLQDGAFHQARERLQEVLRTDAGETRAIELLPELERREREFNQLRNKKEQLYQSALQEFENGEISAALVKLEKVVDLNRRSPDIAVPGRDEVYQTLYDQIRAERDAIRTAYSEGRRHLARGDSRETLEICEERLKKCPGDALFQGLKLEAEEQRRQRQTAFVSEIRRRIEAEPNLDRSLQILKEAAERYPDEQHFQRSLHLIEERRDLANSIVARARQYEERCQFEEALNQWETLRKVYPGHPGIDMETSRLTERCAQQRREEAKSRDIEPTGPVSDFGEIDRTRKLNQPGLAAGLDGGVTIGPGIALPPETGSGAPSPGVTILSATQSIAGSLNSSGTDAKKPTAAAAVARGPSEPKPQIPVPSAPAYPTRHEAQPLKQGFIGVRNKTRSALENLRPYKNFLTPWQWATLSAVPMILLLAWFVSKHSTPPAPPMRVAVISRSVSVQTNVPGATISIDGQVQPTFPVQLSAGTHTVLVSADGYQPVTLVSSNAANTLIFDDGKSQRAEDIQLGPARLLTVRISADKNVGRLILTSNVEDAQIFIDNQPQKRSFKGGSWSRYVEPKTYMVRVFKDGYQPLPERKVEIAKGESQSLDFSLQPEVTTAELGIQEGTPEASVWLNGTRVGNLNSTGSYHREGIAPGEHVIELKRDNFETLPLRRRFSKGQTITLAGADAHLKEFGTLEFQISPSDAHVSYAREGESQTVVKNNQKIPLREGSYIVRGQAEGHQEHSQTIQIASGKPTVSRFTLARRAETKVAEGPKVKEPKDYFLDPSHWRIENGWWHHSGGDNGYMRSRQGTFSFNVVRQSKRLRIMPARCEWVVDYRDDSNKVEYSVDDKNLVRKRIRNGKTDIFRMAHNLGKPESYRLQIQIELNRVITNVGVAQDSLADPDANFTVGKFGFKGAVALSIDSTTPAQ